MSVQVARPEPDNSAETNDSIQRIEPTEELYILFKSIDTLSHFAIPASEANPIIMKKDKLQQFRWRLKSIGSISHHDSQWREIFEFYGYEWKNWWNNYCEGLHNLTGSFIDDRNLKKGFGYFTSIFGLKGEKLFIKWLYTGQKKYLQHFYDWIKIYMKNKLEERQKEFEKENVEKKKQIEIKKEKWGYIYLIKAGKFYKIGKSKKQGERVMTHQSSNPEEVKLILERFVKGYEKVEKKLLKMFNKKLVKGEWFQLNEQDINKIKQSVGK